MPGVPAIVPTMSRKLRAAPNGQSRLDMNRIWMTLAIVIVWTPPSRSGVTKSPIAGMKVSRAAAMMPGIVRGRVTCLKAARPFAYRSRAAATSAGSRRSIETYRGRIANGRNP